MLPLKLMLSAAVVTGDDKYLYCFEISIPLMENKFTYKISATQV
jgi:hypothetical protein